MSFKTFLLGATISAACLPAFAQAESPWTHDAADDRIGRIYYYERSNSDGTMAERVTVYRQSASEIAVYKENGLCRRAALVTATLDLETLSAPVITGGQLQPNAQHIEFAFLELNPETGQVDMLVQLPDMEIRNEAEIEHANWTLFDFDLASFTVATPHLDNLEQGFDFGMALLWADPSAPDPFFWMGGVSAEYIGRVDRLGIASRAYHLVGSAFENERSTGEEGQLWLDARDGHVVEAVFPVPNHPGYTDFRLRLLAVSDGGEAEWTSLLTAHFEGCD